MSLWNPSVSGEQPANIAVRQGGLAPLFTVTGNSIPATTTPFTVALVDPTTGFNGGSVGSPRIGVFTGHFCGVDVTLT